MIAQGIGEIGGGNGAIIEADMGMHVLVFNLMSNNNSAKIEKSMYDIAGQKSFIIHKVLYKWLYNVFV